jgi:hypothetical protein
VITNLLNTLNREVSYQIVASTSNKKWQWEDQNCSHGGGKSSVSSGGQRGNSCGVHCGVGKTVTMVDDWL